ncbi:MAG: hypothetical protein VKJ24_12300 [Synechococcales bacterium]|nr:hypothetical protein [Synechococcales bacterium]
MSGLFLSAAIAAPHDLTPQANVSKQQRFVMVPLETAQFPTNVLAYVRSIAYATTAQAFQTQPHLMQLTLQLVGERSGQQVTLLSVTLSRQDWQAGLFDRRLQDAGISGSLLLNGQVTNRPTTGNSQPVRRGRGGIRRSQVLADLD